MNYNFYLIILHILAISCIHQVSECMVNGISKPANLSIFYVNDMHGHTDNMNGMIGAARGFDEKIKQTGRDSLKLSAGDNYAGGDTVKNDFVLNLLDYMNIDFSAVGNHEFDPGLTNFANISKDNKVKFLAANAKIPEGSNFYNNVQRSVVKEINGNKYGIIGLMPFDLLTVASKTEGLEGVTPYSFEQSVPIVQGEIEKLKKQGINKIILLSHIGADKDKEIASMLDGIDVIVGGHSHTVINGLKEGENLLKSKSGEPVLIVQTGENGANFGELDIEFNENGIITKASNTLSKANTDKSPILEALKNTALGPSQVIGRVISSEPLPENRRLTPCGWTNFMCDAMKSELGTDIAIINAGNTRAVPKAGKLTARDIKEGSPLQNKLLTTKMTEAEVVKAIENGAKKSLGNTNGEPGLLHVGGLTYKVDSKGNLLEMFFIDKQGNKTPINIENPSNDKVYTVAYDSFLTSDRKEKTEYPELLIKGHKYQDVKYYDFDKDKVTIDYISKLPNKDSLEIKDDHRMEVIKDAAVLNTSDKNSGIKPVYQTNESYPTLAGFLELTKRNTGRLNISA